MSAPPTFDELYARYQDEQTRRWTPEDLRQRAEEQEALGRSVAREHEAKALAAMGVPSRYHGATFAQPTQAILEVQSYLAEHLRAGRCLVLSGPTGVGKTYAVVAALRAMSGRERAFRYFPALVAAWLDPERRADARSLALDVDVLALDDLGVEYVKTGGLVDSLLDELIWTREGRSLPTLITTNLTTDALRTRLSDRIVDRLRGEWGVIVEVQGDSLRGQP